MHDFLLIYLIIVMHFAKCFAGSMLPDNQVTQSSKSSDVKNSKNMLDPYADHIRPVIIEGNIAPSNKYPWMVTIRYKSRRVRCAGVMITKRFVLTAAHCLSGGPYEYKDPPMDKDGKITDKKFSTSFILGGGGNEINKPQETFQVEEIIIHPNFSIHDAEEVSADIAVIKLSKPIKVSRNISEACLPQNLCLDQPSQKGKIAGWGDIGVNIKTNILMEGKGIRIWENKECADVMNIPIDEYAICAGGKGGPTSCAGDSGGPLFVNKFFKNYVIGLTSYGSITCEKAKPVRFTRISSFLDWIRKHSDYEAREVCKFPKGYSC